MLSAVPPAAHMGQERAERSCAGLELPGLEDAA